MSENLLRNCRQKSHYNRAKSKRIYLSYELNIKKLWEMYNESASINLKVSETMFRRVFEKDFNIGFSSPSCDICSTCELLKNKQKVEKRPEELESLKIQLRIHKIRAKRFFELAKEKPENSVTFCFDLQQIQCLPKTPIQESFYLRQIGFYNFCVTDMETKNPHFFTWTEDQARKGSSEVASALLTFLISADLSGVEVVRLFADGCGGQNKNSHVVHMLIFWLHNHAPANVMKIVLTFPVRGHSFLPADRVFGRVEKDLRKKPFILNPKTYREVYAKHGKVLNLGEDWHLYDIKMLENYYKKVEQIRDAKRIIIDRISTIQVAQNSTGRGRGQRRGTRRERIQTPATRRINYGVKVIHFYNSEEKDETVVSLQKPSQNHPTLLRRAPTVNDIKQQKKKDVEQILQKQFGDTWSDNVELEWFKTILSSSAANRGVNSDDNVDDEHEECDCCEVDIREIV